MDAVILAAGRGTRATGVTSEFHKPLLTMGPVVGEYPTLLRNAVECAHNIGVARPIVVASPANVLEIDHDLRGIPVDIVIQRLPIGPGDALRVGLGFKPGEPSKRVLVLLADNVQSIDDVVAVSTHGDTAVGVRRYAIDEANRFTWHDPDQRRWREKETPPDRLAHGVNCWVGPFVGYRENMEHVLSYALPINGEYAIGPHLNELTNFGRQVFVRSHDVGTTEAYLAYLRGTSWKTS